MINIAVAMSGGIDSSAALLMLAEKGYNVIGITMKIIPNEKAIMI